MSIKLNTIPIKENLSGKPETGVLTSRTTQQLLKMYQRRDENLTAKTRDQIKRNPYVYAALRNTADELVGKWNGASGYIPRDRSEEHLRRPPQILAASTMALHQRQAEHLRWNVDYRIKRGWETIIRSLLHGREDGKSVLEIKWAWQPSGPYKGTWIIDDILHCDPDMFNFTYKKVTNQQTGEVEFERQMNYNPNGGLGGKAVPPGKFILYSFDRAYENDEGNSILNKLNLYDWYQRNNFIFWLVDLNRYGSPLLVGTVPKGASDQQREALLAAIDSVQQETGILIDETEKIEILQAQRNGAAGFELLNRIINAIIAVVITGNSMSMENSHTGTYSLAKATTAESRKIILYALSTAIDNVINHQLIYWWMLYNYPGTMEYPRHQLLPPRPEEVAPIETESTQGNSMTTLPSMPMQFSEQPETPEDRLVMTSAKQSIPIFEQTWIIPLSFKLRNSDTHEDPLQIIENFTPDLNEYIDLLTRTMTSAHLLGRWQIQQETVPAQTHQFAEDMTDKEVLHVFSSPIMLDKAIDIMLAKRLMPKRVFEQLHDQFKRVAFTIAGKEDKRIQAYIRQEIANAITEGVIEGEELEKRARDAFRRYGITSQTPFHAETVFRTNVQSVLNDARWQMIRTPEIRQRIAYLQYVTKEDTKVRATHRKMHGIIRPMSDPVWQSWWPPNGYNCRCTIKVITQEEANEKNIQPTSQLPNVSPDDGFNSGPSTPGIFG